MQQPGRPREFDEDETLAKIMRLFWENGYEATGLSDIIAATGLGKASLYKAFGNKHAMYLKALGHYETLMIDAAVKLLRAPDLAPLERVEAFLSLSITAIGEGDRRGCFLCNAAADRAALDGDTGTVVRRGYDKMRRGIAHSLAEFSPEESQSTTDARANLILTVYSGLRVLSRAGGSAETLNAAKDETMRMLTC